MAPKKIRRISDDDTPVLTDFEEMRKEANETLDGRMLENRLKEIDELELEEADAVIDIQTWTKDSEDA